MKSHYKQRITSVVEMMRHMLGSKLHPKRHKGITDNKTLIVGAYDRGTGQAKASVLLGTDVIKAEK